MFTLKTFLERMSKMSHSFSKRTPGYGRIADIGGGTYYSGVYDPTSWKTTDKGYNLTVSGGGSMIGPIELLFVDEVNIPSSSIFDAGPSVSPYAPVVRQPTGELYFNVENAATRTPRPLGRDRYAYTTPPNESRYPVAVIVSRDMRYPPQHRMIGNYDPNGVGKIIVVDNFGKEYVIEYTIPSMGYGPYVPAFVYLPYNSKRDTAPLSDGMIDFIKSGSALYGAYGASVVLGKLPGANPYAVPDASPFKYYTAIQSALDACAAVAASASSSNSAAVAPGSSSNAAATNSTVRKNSSKTVAPVYGELQLIGDTVYYVENGNIYEYDEFTEQIGAFLGRKTPASTTEKNSSKTVALNSNMLAQEQNEIVKARMALEKAQKQLGGKQILRHTQRRRRQHRRHTSKH